MGMSADWLTMRAADLGRGIAAGQIDPVDLTAAYLDAIAAHPDAPRVYARTTPDRARAEAEAARARARAGLRRGPLDGVPVSWKDLFDSAGTATEAGSALLAGRVPSADAEVLAEATRAGLVCLGKTHMSELAFSGLGLNPITATPPNAIDPALAPGGSSSGAAASVALAMAAGAKLGNMTSAWWAPTLVQPDAPWASGESRAQIILIERTVPHSIMVNRSGKRFCNEAANYSALGGVFHQFDPANYDYLNLPAWLIFDAQYAERYPLGTRMPGQPIPDWVMRADTLEGLAEQIGLDPAKGGIKHIFAPLAREGDPQHAAALRPFAQHHRAGAPCQPCAIGLWLDRFEPHEIGHEDRGGLGINLFGCAHLFQPAVAHHGDTVGQRQRLGLIVGDENHRHAGFLLHALQFQPHLKTQAGIEV
jgi:hypothetical protein